MPPRLAMRWLLLLGLIPALGAADPILVVGAVPQETKPITDAMSGRESVVIDGIPCERGTLGPHEIVVSLTGIGKTNAAMATTDLILRLHPSAAFMTGTAARIRPAVRTGDVIIASLVSFHDVGSLTAAGMLQTWPDKSGHQAPMAWPSPGRQMASAVAFPATPELLTFAVTQARTYVAPPVTLDGSTYTPVVRSGTVATGDLSGVTEAKISDIREKLDPDLMEMESGAFAQVCQFYRVPHLVIRSGSNVAEEKNTNDYLRLSPIAARQAALFTAELVRNLP
jgi:adenosylhomocysteine nucleosidase